MSNCAAYESGLKKKRLLYLIAICVQHCGKKKKKSLWIIMSEEKN